MKNTHLAFVWPLSLVVLFAAPAFAQEKTAPEKAAPEKAPVDKPPVDKAAALRADLEKRIGDKVEMRFDLPYAGTSNRFQMLDLYLPKQRVDDKPLPVVVFIHGGGWSGGDRKGYAFPASILAASGKYAAVSVGYRLSNEAHWPQQIFDCKAAIRWIRGHAKELNLDADKIGATGASAGGHLVTLLGLTGGVKELEGDIGEYTSQSSRVTCVINVCGPMDLAIPLMQGEAAKSDDPAVSALLGGKVSQKLDLAKAASPLTYVTADAVPIMTLHGTKDMRVNFTNAEQIDAALKKVGATSLLIPIVNAGHGIPFGPELSKRVLAFWDMYLRGEKSDISTLPIEAPDQSSKKEQPYHQDRCLYRFRFNYDYSGGQITNFGAHSNDMAHWGMGLDTGAPVEIECLDAKFLPAGSLFNTATETRFRCRYANGVELICESGPEMVQTRFEGTDGWLQTGYKGTTASDAKLLEGLPKLPKGTGDPHTAHQANFIDCVKSRREPRAPVEVGHASAVLCHIANVMIRLFPETGPGHVGKWDATKLEFVGDAKANRMLMRDGRDPWS